MNHFADAEKTILTQAGRVFSAMVSKILPHAPAQVFDVARHHVTVPDLPEAFESFRIVQLSDIHFYEYGAASYYQNVIDTVNAIQPDMIVTTGDIIHYGHKYLALAESFLKQLKAPFGKWSCMGNHDYSDDFRGHAVQRMLKDAGFEMLLNRSAVIEKNGKPLAISGIDDCILGTPNPEAAYQHVESRMPHISLLHNPKYAPVLMAQPKAPDLVLSGHTHGGQIQHILVNWMHKRLFHMAYQYGWFHFGTSKLYVTSGVGSASVSIHQPNFDFALYPFRINTTPEIAVFELTRSAIIQMSSQPMSLKAG